MANKKELSLDEIFNRINKDAGEVILTKGLSEYSYERIPFTSPFMNYSMYGGIPVGKLIEFYGEEHGGKTTTALDIVANYQQMQNAKAVLWVDAENTLDVAWAEKLGVDVDALYILQPKAQSAEEIFQYIIDIVETGEIGLWVLDSIGALFSTQEFEKSIEDKTYAGISGPLTKFSKRIVQTMHGKNCTGIGINQIRDNLNSAWGGSTTPGGHGWRHMSAVRIEFRRGAYIDERGKELSRSSENPCGNIVKYDIRKTKVCPPDRHIGSYTLDYERGINYIKDLVELAILLEIIDQRGAWFSIVDSETGEVLADKIQGQDKLEKFLEENSDILERVALCVDNKIKH